MPTLDVGTNICRRWRRFTGGAGWLQKGNIQETAQAQVLDLSIRTPSLEEGEIPFWRQSAKSSDGQVVSAQL